MHENDITFAFADPFDQPTDDFNPNTACMYMKPVSDLDVHLVFPKPYENPYTFYYGRKFWEIRNSFDNPEIKKLRLFKKYLNFKPL